MGAQRDFNVLDYVRELRDVGVKQEQAEVQARHLELVKSEIESNLATKEDLKLAIAELNATLTFRMCCIVGIGTGLLGGLITALKFVF